MRKHIVFQPICVQCVHLWAALCMPNRTLLAELLSNQLAGVGRGLQCAQVGMRFPADHQGAGLESGPAKW